MSTRMDNFDNREEAIVRATVSNVIVENFNPDSMEVKFYLSITEEMDLTDELPPSRIGENPMFFLWYRFAMGHCLGGSGTATVGDAENAALSDADAVAKDVPVFKAVGVAVRCWTVLFSLALTKAWHRRAIIYSASFKYRAMKDFEGV